MERQMKPGQRVIVALRKMIATGELRDGERIAEIATAERLSVSRMPVRTALRALEQEGLVVKLGNRGYAARGPSALQVAGAIEVRGVLEGLAAHRLARIGLDAATEAALAACLVQGDLIFLRDRLDERDLERFHRYNLRFHDLIVDRCGNPAIGIALARNNHLPFASAAAIAVDWEDRGGSDHLRNAHGQHHAVVAAIRARDADRAETIMRRHAHIAIDIAVDNAARHDRIAPDPDPDPDPASTDTP